MSHPATPRRLLSLLASVLLILAGGVMFGVSTASAAQPSQSTLASDGTLTIYAHALSDHECDSTEWHFIINRVSPASNAPASISVSFANGDTVTAPLEGVTGKAAHYTTTADLTSTVVSATAQIYAGWTGQFVLSHGPCGTTPSSPPSSSTTMPSSPPTGGTTSMPTSGSTSAGAVSGGGNNAQPPQPMALSTGNEPGPSVLQVGGLALLLLGAGWMILATRRRTQLAA